ncbi:hypothetical protein [Nocardiopsis gilva]|uniref:hypothetical protein n=1 Tax=Nocardiopsis gilva TaxID=280236 RepID=UPI0039F0695A
MGELLTRIDARELTEWQAYELVYGPLGPAYEREMLALAVEGEQRTHHLMGAAHFTDDKHPNPIDPPERIARPSEWFTHRNQDDDGEAGGG